MLNCVFVGFSRIFLLGILTFKGLTARPVYKSFGVKGLNLHDTFHESVVQENMFSEQNN
jgi:hypothetical protein